MNTGKLIIARHQESEWNKLGKWTGVRDRHLTEYGFEKSEDMGFLIKDFHIDYAFASMQVRSIETLSCMLNVCERYKVETEHSASLNERDYGDYTGKDKLEMEKLLGEEEFKKLRRGWDYPIPKGETLKNVYDRVVPYYLEHILPKVKEGKDVLVVAHGNSLRALTKYIENISEEAIADVEIPFEAVIVYNLDNEGHSVGKEIRANQSSKTQIVATLGPASANKEKLKDMLEHKVDAVRLNFSWLTKEEGKLYIQLVKDTIAEVGRRVYLLQDLPGPRIKKDEGHTYDPNIASNLTEQDKDLIKFGVENGVDYVALSFVGSAEEVRVCKEIIKQNSGTQKVMAKIERKVAVDLIDEIIAEADAIMIARGDLAEEVPVEKIPFVQEEIIKKCKAVNKPVVVATQMMFSMVTDAVPTRAEVTDVAEAVMQGADGVMLSDETAIGKHVIEAISFMERILIEAEKHLPKESQINPL